MASRPDLTMLQNLNRRLRTGLWQVPPQWKALRRVPGWNYPPQPIRRIQPKHQFLYSALFERIPMLRLEGYRLGETAVDSTGSTTKNKTLTQQMVLRWHELHSQNPTHLISATFDQVKAEYQTRLDNFAQFLVKSKSEAKSRHDKLAMAKIKKDARDVELGRPERYAEHLEILVNRALNLSPTEPMQYFSQTASRKLIKLLNKEQIRDRMTQKTNELRRDLDLSNLGQRTNQVIQSSLNNENPNSSLFSADATIDSTPASSSSPAPVAPRTAISLFPKDATGEPIPSPELFFQVEKEWSTTVNNGAKNSLGIQKDQKVTEFLRHIDYMVAEPDATLVDYLAYVLHTQIITLNSQRLLSWEPYTNYLNHRIYFHAYRLLHTGVKRSSVSTGIHEMWEKEELEREIEEMEKLKTQLAAQENANNGESTAEATSSDVPAAAAGEEPVAQEPVAATQEPVAVTQEPVAATQEPVAAAEGAQQEGQSTQAAVAEPAPQAVVPAVLTSKTMPVLAAIWPKVRRAESAPLSFQQAITHQRLLVLIQNHLVNTPAESFKESLAAAKEADEVEDYLKERELPLTPFWQEVMDEKVRIKHPGESWYNARIEETIRMESAAQEYDRLEAENKAKWRQERAAQQK